MDDAVNRLAHEMADAIAAAVARDPGVEACRQRARAEGFDLQVSLEALVGFTPVEAPAEGAEPGDQASGQVFRMTGHDRRFLRSLRIAADEAIEEVE